MVAINRIADAISPYEGLSSSEALRMLFDDKILAFMMGAE